MSSDNDNLCTTPSSEDVTLEPYAKKSKFATEQTSHISELADGQNECPTSAGNESSLTCTTGQANPNLKEALKDVGFTSKSFIGPLCPQEVKGKVIDDELDKFYKELEQIAPEDVDTSDDCNTEKSAIAQKQQSPASQQEIQVDFSQHVRHHGPHSGQLFQNRPQHPGHLPPHYQHWDASRPPPLQHNSSPYCDYGTQTRPQRLLYRPPPPFLPPPPPPPRMVSHPLYDDGPRHNFRDQSQETFRWEDMPIKPRYANQGDNHCAYQDHYKTTPNEFVWDEDHRSQPPYSQPRGQAGSFCQENSEECESYQQDHTPHSQTADPNSLRLILMRGAPGSGKSTMAREILSSSPHGLIFSTDDYFLQDDHYMYEPRLLGDAHNWNQNRTQEALCDCRSPIIIDNTNMQAWEMKPYVQMALERGYIVRFCEPNTSWKYDPAELGRRNKHGVPRQKIAKMLERFERPVTVDTVLNSQEPLRHCTEHAFNQQMKRRRDCFQ